MSTKPTMSDIVAFLIHSKLPVLYTGDPGVGKTSAMSKVAEQIDYDFQDFVASIRTPEELNGIPYVVDGKLMNSKPVWMTAFSEGRPGIFFIDELTTCSPPMQASLLKIIHEGKVGDHTLPSDVIRVAACNSDNVSGTFTLSHPLANRFVHVPWEISSTDWADGIVTSWSKSGNHPIPFDPNWRSLLPKYRSIVAQFIRSHGSLLHKLPEDENFENLAWPSPRTWDMAITLLALTELSYNSGYEDLRAKLLNGTVGKDATNQVSAYLSNLDIPDTREVLDNWDTYDLTKLDRPDILNVVVTSVVGITREDPVRYWINALEFYNRLYAFNSSYKAAVVSNIKHLVTAITESGAVPRTAVQKRDDLLNYFTEVLRKAEEM